MMEILGAQMKQNGEMIATLVNRPPIIIEKGCFAKGTKLFIDLKPEFNQFKDYNNFIGDLSQNR